MKPGNGLKNGALLLASLLVALLLSELIVRQFLHPVDYLLPRLIEDPIYGHRIAPGTGGHDAWGFRNYDVPSSAEIVAIGDSQTYGISATSNESWPAHLSNLSESRVYNMALGKYGPLQYLQLLQSKALELNPRVVIVGLYFGNDFIDAYNLAYSRKHWADFRNPLLQKKISDPAEELAAPGKSRFLGGIRSWMAERSVLYRVVTQSVLGNWVRHNEFLQRGPTVIDVELAGVRHLFNPDYRLSALDINLLDVREGIRISKKAIKQINSISRHNQIKLMVALIPTKELVYSELLYDKLDKDFPATLAKWYENENLIRSEIADYLRAEKIRMVDPLPALKNAASLGQKIYPLNDGHTNGDGYSIIAKEIHNAL